MIRCKYLSRICFLFITVKFIKENTSLRSELEHARDLEKGEIPKNADVEGSEH